MRSLLIPATMSLAIIAGVASAWRHDVGMVMIGLCLLGLVGAAGPRALTQLTILVAATTLPSFIPNVVQVGALGVNVYEPILAVLVLRMAAGSRALPHAAKSALAVLAALIAVGVVVGLTNGAEIRWIIFDVRGLITLTAAAAAAAYVASDQELRAAALRAIKVSLWISAGFSLAAVLGAIDVGGRIEDAGLYLDGEEVSSGATRLLTDATHLALAVLCVALAAGITQRVRLSSLVPYVLPALVVTTFAFSRNALIAVGLAAIISLLLAGMQGIGGGIKTAIGVTVVGAIFAGTAALLGGQVWDFAQTQWVAYSERVVAGVSSDLRGRDASTLQRLAENKATRAAIAESPVIGHGFGYAYRPAFGRAGTFAGDEGRFYSHNFYYWLGIKTGLMGLAAFLWVALRLACRGLRQAHSPFAVGALAMLAVNIVAPLPLSTESSGSVTMGALLGVCIALVAASERSRREGSAWRDPQPVELSA